MNKAVALLPALAFTEAPPLMRTSMTATWLLEAALCNGVSPTLVFRPTCIGVMPRLNRALQLQRTVQICHPAADNAEPTIFNLMPCGCDATVRADH